MKNLIKDLTEQAIELVAFGNSREKSEGKGMLRVISELSKPMESEIDTILKSIEIIETDEGLSKKFRTRYATEFTVIKACAKDNMLKKEAINYIKSLTI
mgnify:CR=1 FL=1|tara:strand:+ start:289 stop:585 length:297 start_codon:yes stop_codon:yes gene_type:complete